MSDTDPGFSLPAALPEQDAGIFSRKGLLIRCPEGLHLTIVICSLGQLPLPQHTEEQRVTWSVGSSAEVTLFARSYSPLLSRSFFSQRGSSHGRCKCHHAGPGSAHLGKSADPQSPRNNSPDQKPLMYREHLRKMYFM